MKFLHLVSCEKNTSNGFRIRQVLVDTVKVDKIDFEASRWFKVVLREGRKLGSLAITMIMLERSTCNNKTN